MQNRYRGIAHLANWINCYLECVSSNISIIELHITLRTSRFLTRLEPRSNSFESLIFSRMATKTMCVCVCVSLYVGRVARGPSRTGIRNLICARGMIHSLCRTVHTIRGKFVLLLCMQNISPDRLMY